MSAKKHPNCYRISKTTDEELEKLREYVSYVSKWYIRSRIQYIGKLPLVNDLSLYIFYDASDKELLVIPSNEFDEHLKYVKGDNR